MNFKEKYGPAALVAGGSEGLGAAWARALAQRGLDVVVVARKPDLLQQFTTQLSNEFSIKAIPLVCDLSQSDAAEKIFAATGGIEIGFMVYNAGLSYIGPFLDKNIDEQMELANTNVISPLKLVHHYAKPMLEKGRGGMVLMTSLAGLQGSGFLTAYASSKAYNRVLAESLWYEWKNKGVDIMACIAGITTTPNFHRSNPGNTGFMVPKGQKPEEVVEECLNKLGKEPSHISGMGNRFASFFMQKIFSRKMAINLIGNTTRKIYRIP